MRGCRAWWAALAGLIGLVGCASRTPPPCRYPGELAFAESSADSLGLEVFLALPKAGQELRRAAGARWRQRAADTELATPAWQALVTAVGLAPDDAPSWLALGELARRLGERAYAQACLDHADAATALSAPTLREQLRLRLALQRAWLHRDRGEWSWGLAWVDTALALLPSDHEALLLQGLLLGQSGRETQALLLSRDLERLTPLLSDWTWVRGMASLGGEQLDDALHWLGETASDPLRRLRGDPLPGITSWMTGNSESIRRAATPSQLHRADYWSDLALVCERLGRRADAERYHVAAAKSLPLREPSCLRRVDLPLRETDADAPRLPVWLAFDRYLAVGSWWAYGLEAARRYEYGTTPVERTFWGDAAVGALSVCIRKGLFPLEARAVRGRLYVQLEAYGLAEADLTKALGESRQRGRVDPALCYWLGFLRVKGERYAEALPLLREATAADSTRGAAWSTLGYALVMTGDQARARAALDRAVALDPGLTAAWFNRGLLNLKSGLWEDALRDLRRASELAPDNAEIASTLRRATAQADKARRTPPPPVR